jgi:hypothetical protein
MKGTHMTRQQSHFGPDDPRPATPAQEAKSEKERILDNTITLYLEAARHASLEELAEITDAVERLHSVHADAIAQRHREDAERLSRRSWQRGHLI